CARRGLRLRPFAYW
nr:immunoglobulin heavy chain junction region [Mus musculus]MBK4187694.1 immunoglobulin heavy chain junction region [Mus musculus]